MTTVLLVHVLAWTAALAVCVAASIFGQTARSAPRRRRSTRSRRAGLLLSLSGPWLVTAIAAAVAVATGAWLTAAATAAGAVVVVAVAGHALTPR